MSVAEPATGPALAARVVDLAEEREPTLGSGRLICIDGLAGSGKTTFSRDLATVSGAPVIHLDDIYPGWRGLDEVAAEVMPMLRELSAGRAGHYRRWDWVLDRYTEEVEVPPAPMLVLEGVGAGQRAWAGLITVLVWIDADREVRMQRGLERDGVQVRDQWRQWQSDEQEMLARERTDVRADVRWRT